MSLLLDALNRASKEKAAAATGAAGLAASAAPVSPSKLALDANVHPGPLETSPAPDWPNLALSPEPELAAPATAVVQPATVMLAPVAPTEPAPVEPPPVVQASEPVQVQSPPDLAPEMTLVTAEAPAAAMAPQPAAKPVPPSPSSARVAQEIQRAKAPAPVPAKRPPWRLIILGAVASVLALGFSSVLLGWWGDPTALFLPATQSALVPASPMAVSNPATEPPSEAVADEAAPVVVDKPSESTVTQSALTTAPAPKPAMPARSESKEPRIESKPRPAPEPETRVAARKETASIQRRSTGPSALEVGYEALTQGRLKEAAQAYTQALTSNPEERDALLGLAYIAHQQGRNDEANVYYRRVLRQDPGNAVAQAGLIALGARDGSQESASRARDVADQNPKSAAAQAMLGHSLVQENRLADAQQAFYQAHLLEPSVASHAFNLAVALDRMRNYPSARRYYELALVLSAQAGGERASNVPHAAIQARLEQLRAPAVADATPTLSQ
jgi:tetratricopeptide (TPR) repeat protein